MTLPLLRKTRFYLCRVLEWGLIVAVGVLVCDVLWGVFTRYFLNAQAEWSEELARFLLIWISLLGGAAAFGEKAHLGVDYFVGLFDPGAQKIAAVFGYLIILVFALTVFIYGGAILVGNNLEQTTPALGWRMGHVYLALPIAGVFITIITLEQIIETCLNNSTGDGEV